MKAQHNKDWTVIQVASCLRGIKNALFKHVFFSSAVNDAFLFNESSPIKSMPKSRRGSVQTVQAALILQGGKSNLCHLAR